jgi:hypothetical protein
VVETKAERVKNFHHNTLASLKELTEATGLHDPSEFDLHHFMRRVNQTQSHSLSSEVASLEPGALLTSKGFKSIDKNWPHVFQDFWAHASEQSFSELKPSSHPIAKSSNAKNQSVELGETGSLI